MSARVVRNTLIQIEPRVIEVDPRRVLHRLDHVVVDDALGRSLLKLLVRQVSKHARVEAALVAEVICNRPMAESRLAVLLQQYNLTETSFAVCTELVRQHQYNPYQGRVYYVWPRRLSIGKRLVMPALLWKNGHASDLPELYLHPYKGGVYPAGSHLVLRYQ